MVCSPFIPQVMTHEDAKCRLLVVGYAFASGAVINPFGLKTKRQVKNGYSVNVAKYATMYLEGE